LRPGPGFPTLARLYGGRTTASTGCAVVSVKRCGIGLEEFWTPIAAWQPVRAIDSLDFSNAS